MKRLFVLGVIVTTISLVSCENTNSTKQAEQEASEVIENTSKEAGEVIEDTTKEVEEITEEVSDSLSITLD